METGQYLQDGTVKWIIADIRDGDRVGDITFHPTLLPGHIKANRAAWADASIEIPRLLAWVQANNMLTTDATDESKYLYDSENDILTLPNVMDRVLQGGNAVECKEAGLPNITGSFAIPSFYQTPQPHVTGAFGANASSLGGKSAGSSGNAITVGFSASRSSLIYGKSSTVQPHAITLIPQIKY